MSDGASLRDEKACPDCPMTKNRPEMGLERLVEFSTMSDGSTGRKGAYVPPAATRGRGAYQTGFHLDVFCEHHEVYQEVCQRQESSGV